MRSTREKVAEWLESNPEKWLTQSFSSIGKEIGISAATVDRYLPELIADRDNTLPSEVMRKRKEAGLGAPGRTKADEDIIRKCIEEHPDAGIRDIAYLAKCTPRAVKRVMEKIKQELEKSQSTDNKSDNVNDTESEMAKLEAEFEERRAALLKN